VEQIIKFVQANWEAIIAIITFALYLRDWARKRWPSSWGT
jgi:hypothetical protein